MGRLTAWSALEGVGKMARGAVTVARRRGIGYYGYLATGVLLPRALYRFGWGPSAPAVSRTLFGVATPWFTQRPDLSDLRRLGLLTDATDGAPASRPDAAEVETLMNRTHAAGVTGIAASFGRLGRAADGTLRFTSLPDARRHAGRGAQFAAARDADRRAFNAAFGTDLLTEATARRELRRLQRRLPTYQDYAPIDFGGGLGLGQIASTDSGTGRWEFFNGRVVGPIVAGKRVLDLGANNGSLPLMMLRAGAAQVVAIEGSPEIADLARLNGRILEWRDMARYDLQVLTGDMRLCLVQDLGRFDVVTAFCSLYYLPEADMARMIAHAAAMGATLVLQANEAIGSNLPGRTTDLLRLMAENGYPTPRVHRAAGFARPILVGEAPVASGFSARTESASSGLTSRDR
jgi:hypothetical protein